MVRLALSLGHEWVPRHKEAERAQSRPLQRKNNALSTVKHVDVGRAPEDVVQGTHHER